MKSKILILFVLLSAFYKRVFASHDGFVSVQVGTNVCYYVSNTTLYPFIGSSTFDAASFQCSKRNLNLAKITNDNEKLALWNMIRCKMSAQIPGYGILYINYDNYVAKLQDRCTLMYLGDKSFYTSSIAQCDGSMPQYDGCEDKQLRPIKCINSPPFFACRKEAACNTATDICFTNSANQKYCYKDFGIGDWDSGNKLCQSLGGHLPNILTPDKNDFLDTKFYQSNQYSYWIGLRSNVSQIITSCTGTDCTKVPHIFWIGNADSFITLTDSAIGSNPTGLQEDTGSKLCFANDKSDSKWSNKNCLDPTFNIICEFDGKGLNPTDPPDYVDNKIVCSETPAVPPSGSFMTRTHLYVPMCPFGTVQYNCSAGGINVFKDDITQNTIVGTCDNETLTLKYNNTLWPVCVSYLNCTPPPLENFTMSYDWKPSKGLKPSTVVTYTCNFPKKKILLKTDLAKRDDTGLMVSRKVATCQTLGMYDIDILQYTCTKPCIVPKPWDPTIFRSNWNSSALGEYNDTIEFKCLYGQKFVLRSDFDQGLNDSLQDNLVYTCLINGFFNDTSGTYTCTRNCSLPVNYSSVMKNDNKLYTKANLGVPFGSVFKYTCNDPTKLIVNFNNQDDPLVSSMNVTCQINGLYDKDILQYGCISCSKPWQPANGSFDCTTKSFSMNTICYLKCDPGFIPATSYSMICQANVGNFSWSQTVGDLRCIRACHLVVGGMDSNLRYFSDVEVFCPKDSCSGFQFPSLPYGVIGQVGGFVNGTAFICGGAQTTYTDCTKQKNGNHCKRNVECITTAGASLWCTGPKTNTCYKYDRYNSNSWIPSAVKLKMSRAYAAYVMLPDNRLWILGGAGSSKILNSTEFLTVDENSNFKVTRGPDMPEPLMYHCAMLISSDRVIVIGGFSPILNDYSPTGRIYDFLTNEWTTSLSMSPGSRMTSACGNVEMNGVRQPLLAGGWNSTVLDDSAIYSPDNQKWIFYNPAPLPVPLRSAVMIERNRTPFLIGGLTCSSDIGICSQTNTTLTFDTSVNLWIQTQPLQKGRSSHSVITIPRTLIPGCK